MTRFGPKLEPGETLVWREPALRHSWLMPLAYPFFWGLAYLYFDLFGDKPMNPEIFWPLFGIFSEIALIYAPIAFLLERWKVAVTDHRVLCRDGFLRTGWEEMPRHAITEVIEDMSAIILRGDGREMRVNVGGEAPYLHALLTGTLEAATTVELAPGEAEVLRLPARWRRWRIMLTDRRIIYRPSVRPPEIQQMSLDEIEDVHRDIVFDAILLFGAKKELEIRVNSADTARLLRALDQPVWEELPLRP